MKKNIYIYMCVCVCITEYINIYRYNYCTEEIYTTL